MATSVSLSEVKIIRTGSDGGHLYIRGRGELPDHGECDVYAYFRSKDEEAAFARQFCGQTVLVVADAFQFTQGMGASIPEITSWKIT